jgi:hypothetical protein
MGQYTVSLIKNRPILIDAGEAGWIKEHGSEDNLWADINPQPELERSLRLVYGCFIVNPSQVTGSLNPQSLHVMQGMEMAYIHFEPKESRFYAWRSLMIVDLEMLDGHTKSDRLAFAAVERQTNQYLCRRRWETHECQACSNLDDRSHAVESFHGRAIIQ